MVDKRISGATSGATNMAKKHPIRANGLTDKQRVFVKIYAENEGRLTPTECARQAGYAEGSANVTSSQLLNGKRYPIARDLRTSQKYQPRVVRDKTKYDRKARNSALEKFKEMFERW